ncbi:hypothetical protein D3C86_1499500 [compost metagenome]
MPIVSPVIKLESLSLACRLNNCPPQDPSNTSCTRSVSSPSTFSSFILCEVAVAVKVNHTSSSAVPTPLTTSPESVALTTVPDVLKVQESLAFTATEIAPIQSSLAGAAGGTPTQILKVVDSGTVSL